MRTLLLLSLLLPLGVGAQLPVVEELKLAAVKVIKAIDLKVQRWQNETIWLQNAQQALEQALTKARLTEIGDWAEKQRSLYAEYFDELSQVKAAVADYREIKELIALQARLARDAQRAQTLFARDRHFTAEEKKYMGRVYGGLLEQSIQNLDLIGLAVTALTTRMSDGERLEIIHAAAGQVEQQYADLQQFTQQNSLLSVQRARDREDAAQIGAIHEVK